MVRRLVNGRLYFVESGRSCEVGDQTGVETPSCSVQSQNGTRSNNLYNIQRDSFLPASMRSIKIRITYQTNNHNHQAINGQSQTQPS